VNWHGGTPGAVVGVSPIMLDPCEDVHRAGRSEMAGKGFVGDRLRPSEAGDTAQPQTRMRDSLPAPALPGLKGKVPA
jgi:hypothetical protein